MNGKLMFDGSPNNRGLGKPEHPQGVPLRSHGPTIA